jgi:bis(5'-nucleosidyl)-tetraphosphatase
MNASPSRRSTVLSAGIVPVRLLPGGPRLLLLRAYRYWDFPKGETNPGEGPLATACREFSEETGLPGPDFRWGEVYIETEPYARGKIARYYIAVAPHGEVTLPVNPALGRPEHQEYRWVTPSQAHCLLNARLRRVLDWARGHLGS